MKSVVMMLMMVMGISVASAMEMVIEWKTAEGKAERDVRELKEVEGVVNFSLSREEILAHKAKSVELKPSFARAKQGDRGFWVVSSGEYGTFREANGKCECNRWQLMSVFGMQTPERTFAAIVKKLKYYFTTRVVAKQGEYQLSVGLEKELASAPYEDFEIEFRMLQGEEATLGGIARAYRNYQLNRGACKPLAERVKTNPTLKAAIDGVEVRIRQGWKPVPPKVLEQSPENEPPVKPVVTFNRVIDIVNEFKRQGVDKAELCLVGWQVGGHDGRWPQVFPVEPVLGGIDRLRAAIRAAREAGYLIVPHGNYLDAYQIAESWDEEWLKKDAKGNFEKCGTWGGGQAYRICPQRAHERFMSREMPRMADLGFRGLGYFDVASIVPAPFCRDVRHPLNRAEGAMWWGRSAALCKRCFGGFASEGAFDHFVGELDYALYVSFTDPKLENKGLVDRMVPFPQLVYNGIFAMNPFACTVNFTAQDRYSQLKLIEFGGRPSFYFYSKFKDDGKNWMGEGDLGCATDGELKESVATVKAGSDIYAKLSPLQYVFMREHEEVANGVWRISYENGVKVYVNYGNAAVKVDGIELKGNDFAIKGL